MSLSFSSVALADGENPMLNDNWRVYAGVFHGSVDSKIGINGDTLPPIPAIDVEDVLGVEDSKTVGLVGAAWHFKPRHALELEIFALNRSDTRTDTFTPPVQIGDLFIEDGQIHTSYDTNLARLSYAYSVMRSDRSELQLMAGIHVARAITPTVAINVAAKAFSIELDSIDGSIIEIDADVAWQPWKHIGFGAGARFFKTEASSKGSDLNGSFEFKYFGPMVYVQATF